jgi:hypothetical protein
MLAIRYAIGVGPGTVVALKAHRKTQLEQRMLMGTGFTDRGLVFAMPDGAPWNPDTIGQAFERGRRPLGPPSGGEVARQRRSHTVGPEGIEPSTEGL